jgi:hypothetical protein
MRASEILRKLADVIDGQDAGESSTEVNNRPGTNSVDTCRTTDTAGIEGDAQVNTKSMVGPLQQKLELLKKAAGISGAYDSGALSTDVCADEQDICPECQCYPCGCSSEQDELAIMKQNAGIPPIIAMVATDEDEPFEG